MNNIILTDNDEFDAVMPICLSEGLGIELQSFWDPTLREDITAAKVAYQSSKLGDISPRSFHGPFADLNCGSYDPLLRELSRQRMSWGTQIATQLGATHIVFHHGYVPHTSPPKNWVPRFAQFWSSFLEDKPAQLNFHLENLLELSPDIIIDSIEAINDPRVSTCLDLGHAHCNSSTPVVTWIEKLGRRIAYAHLHDNDGSGDQHLAIGKGTIPFMEVCHALKQYSPEALWALEIDSDGLTASVQWLRENGF